MAQRSPSFLTAVLGLCALFAVTPSELLAAPSAASIKAQARAEAKIITELRKKFLKLSFAQRQSVIASLSKLQDSDEDGVPDVLEPKAGNVCDIDSDNDGLDDGDEYRNGTNPNKRDSDGDGKEDGEDEDSNGDGRDDSVEVEFKGRLTVGTDPFEGTVGTITFRVDGNTLLRKGDTIANLTLADFAGLCVEVDGMKVGDQITADKIKDEDDC